MTPDNPVRFTLDEAQAAADTWGMNCGPGAIAAVLGLTLDELRPGHAKPGARRVADRMPPGRDGSDVPRRYISRKREKERTK
jgi:hypothetical protein